MNTCIITGADSGIGKAAAKALAARNYKLILPVRNLNRGERTLFEIMNDTGNKNIHLYYCDLSSIKSIKEFTQKIKSKYESIDLLVNNAGAFFSKKHLTVDGIEALFQINYLSRFMLSNLLLDLLMKSSEGKIINVNGSFHKKGKLDLSDINMDIKYSPIAAASRAKLADMLFVHFFSKMLEDTTVTINAVDPGKVATNILYNDPDCSFFHKIIYKVISIFFKSSPKGAQSIIFAAELKDKMNGKFFSGEKIDKASPESYNMLLAENLWKVSERLTGIHFPYKEGAKQILNYQQD
jgi:retinol dehydrogenase 13